MDKATLAGIILAVAGIIGGMLREGGNLNQILQPTAGLIVLGGTLGAVMIQFPLKVFLAALGRLAHELPGRGA
jgi:chemotaxis protein MotA